MLNGAAVMDAALLLIAGNETCPQPQTSEHLAAVEIMKLENIIILQNKVDLIKEPQALEHQKSIAAFVKGVHSLFLPHCPNLSLGNRNRRRVIPDCSYIRTAKIQHRRRKRIHREADPHPGQRLHFRSPTNRHPFLRR